MLSHSRIVVCIGATRETRPRRGKSGRFASGDNSAAFLRTLAKTLEEPNGVAILVRIDQPILGGTIETWFGPLYVTREIPPTMRSDDQWRFVEH